MHRKKSILLSTLVVAAFVLGLASQQGGWPHYAIAGTCFLTGVLALLPERNPSEVVAGHPPARRSTPVWMRTLFCLFFIGIAAQVLLSTP